MKAQRYQIRLEGLIDRSWSVYFAGMTMTAEPPGVTRLSGEVADRSALHGLLNRIAGLNLGIISVQLLEEDGATPVECRHCPARKPRAEQDNSWGTSPGVERPDGSAPCRFLGGHQRNQEKKRGVSK